MQSYEEVLEVVEHGGVRYAEVIRADHRIEQTRFFSPAESSLQFGLLAHHAGFHEPAHHHKPVRREIADLQQMFVVQRGKVKVTFYTPDGREFHEVVLAVGDAILLVHGSHAVSALEDMQCVSVKQGPFLGDENDKILIKVKK
jgi:hypothetical protein